LFDTRINAVLEVEWLSRPLPEFVNRRAAVRASIDFNPPGGIDDFIRLGIRVEGTSDEIFDPVIPPIPAHSKAISVGPFFRAGRLDTDRLRFDKGFIELHADSMATTDPKWPFAEILTLEGQYFWKLGTRFNIATRVMAGLELGARPQDRFYIGGLDRVRGYVYSEIRAQKFAIANSELRFIAFDSMWFAVMPLVFVDGGVAHSDTGRVQPLASLGGGVRLMSPRLVKFGVRFEVAFPLVASLQTPVGKPGINFGIWHYF